MKFCLNELFTSGAVLPHGKPFKIYGNGEGKVRVEFNGVSAETQCADGKWTVTLPPMECGGPYTLEAYCGDDTAVLSDVYVGEVILICGQSNMQFKLKETADDASTYRSNEKLRLFTVDRPENGEHFKTADGWVALEGKTAGEWSALGYYIATEMFEERRVAIGIIACYQGASMIQSWLPREIAEREELFVPVENRHTDYKDYPVWNGDGFLYGNMLSRVLPYSINRMVYYQGESNTTETEGAVYARLLLELIETVRGHISDPYLPVTVVQIADLDVRNDEGWRSVQRAQLKVTHLTENVRTVISADISESDNIHPPTKKPLAERIVKSFV